MLNEKERRQYLYIVAGAKDETKAQLLTALITIPIAAVIGLTIWLWLGHMLGLWLKIAISAGVILAGSIPTVFLCSAIQKKLSGPKITCSSCNYKFYAKHAEPSARETFGPDHYSVRNICVCPECGRQNDWQW